MEIKEANGIVGDPLETRNKAHKEKAGIWRLLRNFGSLCRKLVSVAETPKETLLGQTRVLDLSTYTVQNLPKTPAEFLESPLFMEILRIYNLLESDKDPKWQDVTCDDCRADSSFMSDITRMLEGLEIPVVDNAAGITRYYFVTLCKNTAVYLRNNELLLERKREEGERRLSFTTLQGRFQALGIRITKSGYEGEVDQLYGFEWKKPEFPADYDDLDLEYLTVYVALIDNPAAGGVVEPGYVYTLLNMKHGTMCLIEQAICDMILTPQRLVEHMTTGIPLFESLIKNLQRRMPNRE